MRPLDLPVTDLPEGWTPLEMIGVVKCLDEEGDPGLEVVASESLNSWEALGMLRAAVDRQAAVLAEMWYPTGEDDDE